MSSILDLTVERPVAGGRMLARHDGAIVLVSGAIPGERVRARIERRSKAVTFAETVDVLEPSPDRRAEFSDPSCGGSDYAHVRYERQLTLKGEIIADALKRIGRHTLEAPAPVLASPEHGYRMRARLHVAAGRAGFLREGTHRLCDAGPTGQLLPATLNAVQAVLGALGAEGSACSAVQVSENVAATERVIHLEAREGQRFDVEHQAAALGAIDGVTGITIAGRPHVTVCGLPTVTDTAKQLGDGSPIRPVPLQRSVGDGFPRVGDGSLIPPDVSWTRHATSFFQGNRFLTGALLRAVLDASDGANEVVDLYAGVGLFAVSLAARGANVVAVEGDEGSAADLETNAEPWRERLRVIAGSVEEALAHAEGDPPDVVVLDPPRTGVSRDALTRLIEWRAPKIVYVSCDPPTLARDAAAFFAAGYRLASIQGFDLFPNTPHVETLAVFSARMD